MPVLAEATTLTDWGKLVLVLSVCSAFVVAFLFSFGPMPRIVRTVALIAGPIADFGVFGFFISKDPCLRECTGKAAFAGFAVVAFATWLVGAASGYLLRKAIAYSRKS